MQIDENSKMNNKIFNFNDPKFRLKQVHMDPDHLVTRPGLIKLKTPLESCN